MTVVSKLMEIWVKAPALKGARLAIVSACLKHVNEAFYRKVLEEHDVVLEHCPENENQAFYGKIASIIRSSQPKSITVVTIDGSPHCFQIHAAVNEAVYILSNPIPRKHYVVIYDRVVEISPESIRVARYL
ncbi:MAG: 4Fe-4S ferredoxin, partial [Thermoprotei archaeon]